MSAKTDSVDSLSIHTIRTLPVILDSDLAAIYGVETKAFNQAFKRNRDRFPDEFAFQLTDDEWHVLRSQIVTLKSDGRGRHYATFTKNSFHSFSPRPPHQNEPLDFTPVKDHERSFLY